MRVFLGFLVAAVALSAAVWLHSSYEPERECARRANLSDTVYGSRCLAFRGARADWQDPVAVFVAVAGIGAGLAIVLGGGGLSLRRRAAP
jgi:hypothetical protein